MKVKKFLGTYFNKISIAFITFAFISGIILLISRFSCRFSDVFNRYVSGAFRLVFSKITGLLPFSLGELMVLSLPIVGFVLIFLFVKYYSREDIAAYRYLTTMVGVISIMFSMFVFMFGTGYNTTDLDVRLGLERKNVDADKLRKTADALCDELDTVLDEIVYSYDGSSNMDYSYSVLNKKLNSAYDLFCDDYDIIQKMHSNVKFLAVSPIMTYTHISGVFTYYTGEANVNFNYPCYTAPYTMAHEMAHQRGVAPEDEANFIAFLVCMKSDDPYIKYSGCMSVLEYVLSAYSEADSESYSQYTSVLDSRIRSEMVAFSAFFDQYRDSTASKVTNTVNDTYLKASGENAGTKSYGMVVDLACAYFEDAQY